ncbi:MAG: hypothetical protein M1830_010154 [Pleopsidium flavum]|nr:MAG: hypothetical protein M1830_010154 [Pleopsidium flavum]
MADPVSLSASIVSLLQLTATVVRYLHDVKDASGDIRRLLVEISSIRGLLIGLKDLATLDEKWVYTIRALDGPNGPLLQFKCAIESLATKLMPVVGLAKIGRSLAWPFQKGEIEDVLRRIERHKALFALALEMDHIRLSQEVNNNVVEIQQKVEEMHIAQTDAARNKVLNWLSSTDPSKNHNAACAKHEPMTGSWLIESENFRFWLKTVNSVLWLYGIPGCGKTVLCSTIIERVKTLCTDSTGDGYAYYYFDFNDDKQQTVEGLLRSILVQLSSQRLLLPDEVQNLHDESEKHQLQPKQSSLVETFFLLVRRFRQVYLTIDALDECTERKGLLALINRIATQKPGKVNMLLLSRREQDIETGLETIMTDSISIQDAKVDGDIRLLIHSRLTQDSKLKKRPDSVKREIEEALTDGAYGIPSSITRALHSLPKTLDETYDRILTNIHEEYHTQTFTALQWLVFSARPLYLEEVAEAVALKPGQSVLEGVDRLFDPYEILTICSSLVTLSDETREVRLAHYSIKEYLISERIRRGSASAFHLMELSAHRTMAEMCLNYLLSFDKPNPLSSQSLLDFPLLDYAAQNWYNHARVAEKDPGAKLNSLILNLLNPTKSFSLNNWLRIFQPDDPWYGRDSLSAEIGPPLYYASYLGLLETGRLLLRNGADVNPQGKYYGRPLQAAAVQGYENIVQMLLDHGADINSQSGEYGNALQAAFVGRQEKVILLLLEKGADVTLQGGYYGNALQAALTQGLPEFAPRLLEMGADVNAQGGQFGTALQAASRYWHDSIVRLLIERGANVNAQGGYYGNALQAASRGGSEQIVRLLLKRGAHVNARGGYCGSALKAAMSRRHLNVIQILLEWGAEWGADIVALDE